MSFLQKLPGHRRTPSGLEWAIMKKLPLALAAGTAIPLLCYLYAMLFPSPGEGDSAEKYVMTVGILMIAALLTIWTAILTLGIGCAVVWIMKGPAYVADSYPVVDAEQPQPLARNQDKA